jgi:hypothetical protein
MSDEHATDAVEIATSGENGRQIRLRDLDLRIDEHGRLVISFPDRTSLDILVAGRFTKEHVHISVDTDVGVVLRVSNPR